MPADDTVDDLVVYNTKHIKMQKMELVVRIGSKDVFLAWLHKDMIFGPSCREMVPQAEKVLSVSILY